MVEFPNWDNQHKNDSNSGKGNRCYRHLRSDFINSRIPRKDEFTEELIWKREVDLRRRIKSKCLVLAPDLQDQIQHQKESIPWWNCSWMPFQHLIFNSDSTLVEAISSSRSKSGLEKMIKFSFGMSSSEN
ncbi:hypothetical protein Tco_0550600 [Tanacetum coccineum]|uniref:Uncharacterized protein n=1 Tax=Tanacetum coccineum TaxID=301880 RepID=A0ABQ5ID74_9ASTR